VPTGVYPRKPMSQETKDKLRIARLGKPLSPEHRAKLSAAKLGKPGPWAGKKRGPHSKEWRENIGAAVPRGADCNFFGLTPEMRPWRRYWHNGVCMRSTWEVRFAKALDKRGVAWEYEPARFNLGSMTYLPDFRTSDGTFWEVKGWLNQKSQEKIARFRAVNPDISLVVVTKPVLGLMEV
jgi:NUMOD3 motif